MLGSLQKEPWRSIGNVPFKVIFVDKLRTLPCLSGSLNTHQKSLVLRQCLSGEHTDLYFPCPLMSPLPCRRLRVCSKGETFSRFWFSELIPRHHLSWYSVWGVLRWESPFSPKRTLVEGGPTLSTGYETFVCVSSRQQQHLCLSPPNNTCVASSYQTLLQNYRAFHNCSSPIHIYVVPLLTAYFVCVCFPLF